PHSGKRLVAGDGLNFGVDCIPLRPDGARGLSEVREHLASANPRYCRGLQQDSACNAAFGVRRRQVSSHKCACFTVEANTALRSIKALCGCLSRLRADGGVLMELQTIVMRLARNPGFPEGDRDRGYTMIAPLTRDGGIDEAAWRDNKAECTVRAFAPGEPAREGRLGRRGHNWFFDYERGETADDEPVFKLEQHKFI